MKVQSRLQDGLQDLIGLQLTTAKNAADMKIFHFEDTRASNSKELGAAGLHAIHLQCPWRIVTEDTIVTGSGDWLYSPHEGAEIDETDHLSGTLQHVRLDELLKGYDEARGQFNAIDDLFVISATADPFGGADIILSGGYRLQIFPNGSEGEDWRLLQLGGRHFVVEAGRIDVEG